MHRAAGQCQALPQAHSLTGTPGLRRPTHATSIPSVIQKDSEHPDVLSAPPWEFHQPLGPLRCRVAILSIVAAHHAHVATIGATQAPGAAESSIESAHPTGHSHRHRPSSSDGLPHWGRSLAHR